MLKKVGEAQFQPHEFEDPYPYEYDLYTWAEPGDPPLTQLRLHVPRLTQRQLSALSPAERDARRPISPHLRAPCQRRKVYPSNIPLWAEADLLKRWREDYSEEALNFLVEAYRPKVVYAAMKYVGAPRKLLIEYGMFGLRLAASNRWPNRKKKGTLAGYDPTKARFGSYAIDQARRLMYDAALGNAWRPGEHFADTLTEFREWAKTPIPAENERPDLPEHKKTDLDETFEALAPQVWRWWDGKFNRTRSRWVYAGGTGRSHHADVQDPSYKYGEASNPNCFCISDTPGGRLVYWLEGDVLRHYRLLGHTKLLVKSTEGGPKKRNNIKHQVTAVERENRKKYYEIHGHKLGTYELIAGDSLGGWGEDGDNDGREDFGGLQATTGYSGDRPLDGASLSGSYNGEDWWQPCTGAFDKDKFVFPTNPAWGGPERVLKQRWDLAHKVVSFVRQPGAHLTLGVGDRVIQIDGLAPVRSRTKPNLPYRANAGLGLYDRRGRPLPETLLPQFSLSVVKCIPKNRRNTPEVCLKPVASIYLLLEGEPPVRMGGGFIDNIDLRRMCPPRPLTIAVFRRDTATTHELRHSLLARLPSIRRSFIPLARGLIDDAVLWGDVEPTWDARNRQRRARKFTRAGYTVPGWEKVNGRWVTGRGWLPEAEFDELQ